MTIEPVDPRDQRVRTLIEELDKLQNELYPAESNHLEPVSALVNPNTYFLGAVEKGRILGIGAFMVKASDWVEIKRVYVSKQARNGGLALKLMDALEGKAAAMGYTTARLETGVHQAAAIGLYEKLGYRRTGPFGNYGEDPMSVFMEKTLLAVNAKKISARCNS